MVFFMLAVAFAVTITALYYYFTRTFNYWKKRNVLGPKPMPFFGNIMNCALRRVHMSVTLKDIYDSHPTEKVVGMFRMTTPCLLIRDLDVVKHITIKDFDYFVDRGIEFSKEGLGQNLFHSDGDTWRLLRRHLSPMFTNQKLKNMMPLVHDKAHKFVDYVSELAAKTPEQDILGLMKKFTCSTIVACAFGLDVDALRGDTIAPLVRIGETIFNINFGFELDMMYPGILKKINISLFPKIISEFFKDLVETVVTQRNGVPSTRRDFMDLMLELKNKKLEELEFSNALMEAQAFVFFAAGYDTTSTTLGFMLYHLALESAMQDKLRNEIDEYLQRHGGRIELETLNELTYLDQVFNETLRMYPSADTLLRKADRDYECPGTNLKISKGQLILIPVYAIHHDEMNYPEPEKFNPDNFASENVGGTHSCAFLPFGLGPRRCIGMRFAQLQSRVCLIKLLSKFRLEASKHTARSTSFDPCRISLAPNETIYLNFYARE